MIDLGVYLISGCLDCFERFSLINKLYLLFSFPFFHIKINHFFKQ